MLLASLPASRCLRTAARLSASARRAPLRRRAAMAAASASAPPAAVAEDYSALCERLREISALSGVSGLLGWDEQARFARERVAKPSPQSAAAPLRRPRACTLASACIGYAAADAAWRARR